MQTQHDESEDLSREKKGNWCADIDMPVWPVVTFLQTARIHYFRHSGIMRWSPCLNFHNIFTCPNSQDKNLHIQNILVIFEYVWAKILYHYSKSFKHLERDSTNLSTRVEKKKPWQSVVTCHVANQSTFDKGQGWNHLLVLHLEMHRYNPDKIPVVGMNRLVLLHLRETIYTISVERWSF